MARTVVNHLRLARPLPDSVIAAAEDACAELLAHGATSACLVQVEPSHAMLVLAFPDLETEERVSSEIGGPWMREHVLHLLASPPERSSGPVVAGSL